ncbi:Cathepsin_B [Hexamita inflata]|uniref:Cathepsin B n=1 Tax=Hexamita inflata TaxID=28002 RepID=A0AA86VRM2_9EUKA|nr:Cathepsin B [Hexamita inflata]
MNNNIPLNQTFKTKSSKTKQTSPKSSFQFLPRKRLTTGSWVQMNQVVAMQCCLNWVIVVISAQVSVMNTFSDFRCFQGKDSERVEYSPQYQLNCDTDSRCSNCNQQCVTYWAWLFLIEVGTVPASCISYKSGQTGKTGKCPTTCDDGSKLPELVKAKELVDVCHNDEELIKEALINGPVSTAIWLSEDLYYYESGIYQHVYGKDIGWSSCEFVGYGEENGVKFWKVKNVWGREWGENGYFRVLRGSSDYGGESEIEYECCQAIV